MPTKKERNTRWKLHLPSTVVQTQMECIPCCPSSLFPGTVKIYFERRVTLIQNGRNGDLQILGRVRVGFSTQKHLLSWKVRSLSLAGAKTVYNTKKVL